MIARCDSRAVKVKRKARAAGGAFLQYRAEVPYSEAFVTARLVVLFQIGEPGEAAFKGQ